MNNTQASFIIRKAERKDVSQMMALVRELASYEKAPDEVTVSETIFEESGFGKQPVWFGWVIEDRDAPNSIIGMALCYVRYSTWKGPMLYLEDIIVREELRGKGLGKLLMEKVIKYAKAQKMAGVIWQVLDWNKPAIHFYEQFTGVKFDNSWINVTIPLKFNKNI